MAMLITLDEYHTWAEITSPYDTDTDAQITQAIEWATDEIQNRLGRNFTSAVSPTLEIEEIFTGRGLVRYYTKQAPLNSIDTIEYWDGNVWTEVDIVVTPYSIYDTNYVYFTQGSKFFKPGSLQMNNWKITYTYGGAIPEDLKKAVAMITSGTVSLVNNMDNLRSQEDGEQKFSYGAGTSGVLGKRVVNEIISKYVRW